MAKFLFILTTGTENPSKAVRCLQLARVAKEEGHEVHLFLTDEAVIFGKTGMCEHVVAPTGDEMEVHLTELINRQVPVYV